MRTIHVHFLILYVKHVFCDLSHPEELSMARAAAMALANRNGLTDYPLIIHLYMPMIEMFSFGSISGIRRATSSFDRLSYVFLMIFGKRFRS